MESATSLSSNFVHITPPIPNEPEQIDIDEKDVLVLESLMKRSKDNIMYLDTLDSVFSSLSKRIRQRKKEYEDHVETIRRCLEATHPSINDLPVELLQTVFRIADDDWMRQSTRRGPLRFNRQLWRLSWVCKLWRSAILSDTLLWAAIPPIHIEQQSLSPNLFRVLDTYFQRSLPRTTSLSLKFVTHYQLKKMPFSVINTISRHLSRIHDLSIAVATFQLATIFKQPLITSPSHEGLVNLKSLKLVFSDRTMGLRLPSVLQNLPVLEQLSIVVDIISPGMLLPPVEFPWNQLTSLTIEGTCRIIVSAMQFLPQAGRLRCLKFKSTVQSEWLSAHPDHDEAYILQSTEWGHPTLQTLVLGPRLDHLLTCAALPKLEDLSIGSCMHERTLLSDELSRFGTALTKLVLQLQPALFRELLPLVPRLQSLELQSGFRDDDLILFAQPHSVHGWLVPFLEVLVLHEPCIKDPIDITMMIQARKEAFDVAHFKRIELVHALKLQTTVNSPFQDTTDTDTLLLNRSVNLTNIADDTASPTTTTSGYAFIFYQRLNDYAFIRLGERRGYEVNLLELETFCDEVEHTTTDFMDPGSSRLRVNRDPINGKVVLDLIIGLTHFLQFLDPANAAHARTTSCKDRLMRMLRLLMKNPWPFQEPPVGWSHFIRMDSEQQKRLYLASETTFSVFVYLSS